MCNVFIVCFCIYIMYMLTLVGFYLPAYGPSKVCSQGTILACIVVLRLSNHLTKKSFVRTSILLETY